MSDGIIEKLGGQELGELARAILTELDRVKSASAVRVGESRGFVPRGRYSFSGDEKTMLKAERAGFSEDISAAREPDEAWQEQPRQRRAEFLEQRLQRRKSRAASAGQETAVIEKAAQTAAFESQSVSLRDTTQRISELVCRDARRYDSGFEKF